MARLPVRIQVGEDASADIGWIEGEGPSPFAALAALIRMLADSFDECAAESESFHLWERQMGGSH